MLVTIIPFLQRINKLYNSLISMPQPSPQVSIENPNTYMCMRRPRRITRNPRDSTHKLILHKGPRRKRVRNVSSPRLAEEPVPHHSEAKKTS